MKFGSPTKTVKTSRARVRLSPCHITLHFFRRSRIMLKAMMKRVLILGTVTGTLMSSSAYAEKHLPPGELERKSFLEEVGAGERINLAGKLRMLSQRIAAAACYDHAGIDVAKSAKVLHDATAEFDRILYGLEFGDESLGIVGEEKDRKVLHDLKLIHDHWDYLHPEIEDIIETGGTDEEVLHLAHESIETLKIAQHLVSIVVGEYSDPASLLQADALTIDIAGRQRMLAQRISKFACLISSGLDIEFSQKEMAATRQMYDASLNALRFGMPNAGIHATDDAAILAGLDEILEVWAIEQPILDSIAAGEDVSDEKLALIFNKMNELTAKMNTLVGLYAEDSKQGL
ncbi:MAG: type IV pili methyl-accepting chemotaxis transducer N-terminal domain-containing protein [Paracoccaceae bacterium]